MAKEEIMMYAGLRMKAADTTEKGRVTILANGLNIEDSQGDISMNGSFKKTLADFKAGKRNIFHYKNHDWWESVGFIVGGEETETHLVLESQLNLNKVIGREVYEDYKLAQELGKNIEHSIGVRAVKRDSDDMKKVLEWKLYEVSTLTMPGANPATGFTNLKSMRENPEEAERVLRAMLERKYDDNKLKYIDAVYSLLKKQIAGDDVKLAVCPKCGQIHDEREEQCPYCQFKAEATNEPSADTHDQEQEQQTADEWNWDRLADAIK